ncbi:hypothetical protein ACO0LM_23425 [Undibacterium sp. Di26W]|uniref:hypothetical protein n=1 Tax=Undibacterium sp. Di26W TaxID=3413035 RepID=UPI003BF297E1
MLDRRTALKTLLTLYVTSDQATAADATADQVTTPLGRDRAATGVDVMDMVFRNPGENDAATRYVDPVFLTERQFDAQVIEHAIEGVPTFSTFDPSIMPAGSPQSQLAAQLQSEIGAKIDAAKQSGLKVYAWCQFVILPQALLKKYGTEMVDERGRLDVRRPMTQNILKVFIAELFAAFPRLDGLVIRTGEVYLHDLPYHDSGLPKGAARDAIQSATAITHGESSHVALINLLRDEVCVKSNRTVYYRTWDFGHNFHNNPKYYLDVTDAIDPHPQLIFSIKHQSGDFHRLTPFNPSLATGRHRQAIEVQCQLEAYGKGAHPYYVAQGVIEGWEEYAWLMPAGAARCLQDVIRDPRIKTVWTWSRGGGWAGPVIQDELWCDLNAYVIMNYARDPAQSEAVHFERYGRDILKLSDADTRLLRQACLLSARAVLRGQLSNLGVNIDVWWCRDNTMSEPQLRDIVSKGLSEAAIVEKQEALGMWREIELLMSQIRFATPERQSFARISASYGRIKYAIFAAAWTTLLLDQEGKIHGGQHRQRIRKAIEDYDRLWKEFDALKALPLCPTLPAPVARGGTAGLGAAMDRLRSA